jgi:dihydrofolate reductase
MMASYWPTAADQPGATTHDIDHARWVNPAPKLVFSRTLDRDEWKNTQIVRDNIPAEIAKLKAQPGKKLLIIASATTAHTFMQHGLIDEYHINVNPVVLGGGLPLFADLTKRIELNLMSAKSYSCGVVGLHYQRAYTAIEEERTAKIVALTCGVEGWMLSVACSTPLDHWPALLRQMPKKSVSSIYYECKS